MEKEFNRDDYSFFIRDKIIVALAFGQIIIDGVLDSEIKKKAIQAIKRQQSDFYTGKINLEEYHQERKERLKLMENKLRNFE